MKKHLIITAITLLVNINLFSQIDKNVIVVKEYSPTISNAFKLYTMPSIKDTISYKSEFNYNIIPVTYNSDFEIDPIRPAKLKGEPLKKLYGNYVKIGFGSNIAPLVDIKINNLRSRKTFWGVEAKHYSTHGWFNIDEHKYYPNITNNRISLYGTKFLNWKDISGQVNYKGDRINYYGFTPDEDFVPRDSLTFQRFNVLDASVRYKSDRQSKFKIKYDYELGYYFFFDKEKSTEHGSSLRADFVDWYKDYRIAIDSRFSFYRRAVISDTLTNFILKINPRVEKIGKEWKASLGVNSYVVIDPNANSETFFYPNLKFQYALADKFLLTYFGFTGKLESNFYRKTSVVNPFIQPDYEIRNTNHRKIIYGGLKGDLSSRLSFDVIATYSELEDKMFFVNDTSFADYHRFNVVYDTLDMVNVKGELIFDTKKKFKFRLKANYNKYFSLQNEMYAWNLPEYDITLSTEYNIQNKIYVTADFFVIGRRYAKTYDVDGNVSPTILKEAFDLNLGVEYRYNNKVGGFIRFNNIIASKYYQWNYYPAQRFHVMVGVKYAF